MKKIIFATMVTLSMMIVSCGGNTTETTVGCSDTCRVDSSAVCSDSAMVDTLQVVR